MIGTREERCEIDPNRTGRIACMLRNKEANGDGTERVRNARRSAEYISPGRGVGSHNVHVTDNGSKEICIIVALPILGARSNGVRLKPVRLHYPSRAGALLSYAGGNARTKGP